MKLTDNTIFITGGTSGIGRALAEALHDLGNKVIISGRRQGLLDEVIAGKPGMQAVRLDIEDPADIERVAARLIADFPALNVVINNAGIMQFDDAAGPVDEAMLLSTVSTNLLGPIRLAGALVGHLKQQPSATLLNVSSVLAFVPMAMTAVYCATKAAIHSYTMALRWSLRDTSVAVLEIAPPWVQTDLLGSKDEPRAMPLADFIAETIAVLGTDVQEVLVARAKPMRANPGPGEYAFVAQFNQALVAPA
jgi:uncharacterized oxidoreductase